MKKARTKKVGARGPGKPGLDHDCDWRVAALKLASCVIATLRTGGKIGVGSGLVMKRVHGKTTLERWDKDFIEALALIGVEVVDQPRARAPRPRPLDGDRPTRRGATPGLRSRTTGLT